VPDLGWQGSRSSRSSSGTAACRPTARARGPTRLPFCRAGPSCVRPVRLRRARAVGRQDPAPFPSRSPPPALGRAGAPGAPPPRRSALAPAPRPRFGGLRPRAPAAARRAPAPSPRRQAGLYRAPGGARYPSAPRAARAARPASRLRGCARRPRGAQFWPCAGGPGAVSRRPPWCLGPRPPCGGGGRGWRCGRPSRRRRAARARPCPSSGGWRGAVALAWPVFLRRDGRAVSRLPAR